jgi:hypothetical protein
MHTFIPWLRRHLPSRSAHVAALHDRQLHLLDGDALAIDAAQKNVPDAAGFHLRSSWPKSANDDTEAGDGTAGDACLQKGSHHFDWIVSNPPVHAGQPDDFRVMAELVYGLCFRSGVSCWFSFWYLSLFCVRVRKCMHACVRARVCLEFFSSLGWVCFYHSHAYHPHSIYVGPCI